MTAVASVDYGRTVQDDLTTVTTFVPKLVGALLLLLIGYFIAKVVAKVVDKLLERAGFDRAVERGGIKQALARSQYDASDIVAKVVFFAIFIPFLSAAVGTLGIAALQQPLADFIALLPKIFVALVLVVVGAALAGFVKNLVQGALGGLSYGPAVATGASVLILLGFVKAALDEVGIATQVTTPILYTLLATVAGILVVGVGGGLIKPMQARLDNALNKAADETQRAQQVAKANRAQADAQTSVYPTEAAAVPTRTAAPRR